MKSETSLMEGVQPQPSDGERALARHAAPYLQDLLRDEAGSSDLSAQLQVGGSAETVTLPVPVLRLLEVILRANARGEAVTVVPSRGELTPNQAAAMLGVSRPFLVKLLDGGKIPFRRVGGHRRIRVDALTNYQRQEEQRQLEAMEALAAQAQELDMGY